MARRDPALEPLPHRLEREIFEAPRVGVVGVVDQHVNVEVVALGEIEADVDMLPGLVVGVFVPGQAADHIATHLDGLVEQFSRPRVADDPFLREGDDLNLAKLPILFARHEEALRPAQPPDGADIAEQAEERRPILHTGFDHPAGPLRDLLRVVVALEVVGDLDRLGQRPRHVRPHQLAKQRFVRMQVQIHEARRNEIAGRIDFLAPGAPMIGFDGADPRAVDRDVDESILSADAGVANDEVHIRSQNFMRLPVDETQCFRQMRSRMCRPRVRSIR